MKICSFIHPTRTFLPCSGVGRHMNAVLLELAARPDVSVELLFAKQWLGADGLLPPNCPLRDLPFTTFPWPENLTERLWKLTSFPRMDSFIGRDVDWVYCPMETRLPVRSRPVAVTIHDIKAFETGLPWSDTPGHRRFRRRWSSWIHKTIRECRVVFTVSEFSRQRMIALLSAPPEKIVVSGNGIDPRYFAARQPGGVDASPPSVLIVGGLRTQKGAAAVVAVARACRTRGLDVVFDVAGPNEPGWEEQAREIGNVRFHGWIDDDGLLGLIGKARALLFLSEYEGFGIPAIEAMAAGVPAIVANRASLPEVVGECGYVVEPARPDEICDLLAGLLAGRIAYDTDAGIRRAQEFSWSAVADRVHRCLVERS